MHAGSVAKRNVFGELSPLKDVKDALLFCESLEKIPDGAVSGNSTIAGIGSADWPTATSTSAAADHVHNTTDSLPSNSKAAPGKSKGSKRSLKSIVNTDGKKKAKQAEDNSDIFIQSQLEQHFIGM